LRLHVIIGPSGTGTAERATRLSKSLRAPTLVIDRFQVFRELATGTGRPRPDTVGDAVRMYLDDRRIVDGELSPGEAYVKLSRILRALSRVHADIILEGSSVALWSLVMERSLLDRSIHTLEILRLPDDRTHIEKLRSHVRDMLAPASTSTSIAVELARVWDDPTRRALVRTLVGYDAIADHCAAFGTTPRKLSAGPIDPVLVAAMVDAHLRHARAQQIAFCRLFAGAFLGRSSPENVAWAK
jgi:adenylate dimethylallyltransferase